MPGRLSYWSQILHASRLRCRLATSQGPCQLAISAAGGPIRYGSKLDIQTGRDAPVAQVIVKFHAQQFFNFTQPRSQSCHGDTSPENDLSVRCVVHCSTSEKREIPTDGHILQEQTGIFGRIKSKKAITPHRNQ